MNKRIRFLAAVLALVMALTLGLCGCTPKTESKKADSPAREGVSTYGTAENVAPDGTPFETVYVPGIYEFERSFNPTCRFSTSPNGLYVWDEEAKMIYEFDANGHFLSEMHMEHPSSVTPNGIAWRLEGQENKADYSDRHIDYHVYRLENEIETEVLSFRTEQGTATLVATDDYFLIIKAGWDENNAGLFALESYGTDGQMLHSQDLTEWCDVYVSGNEVYFAGRDSYNIFRYDAQNYSLNKIGSIQEGSHIVGFYNNTIYFSDNVYLYHYDITTGENKPLFRFDSLYISGNLAPIPIGGTDAFFFNDVTNQVSPFRIAYTVDKDSIPAERKQIVLAINEPVYEWTVNQFGSYRDQIVDFNTVNQEYEIVIRNYAESPDPFLALTADMAGGNAPDLIDVRGFGSAICSPATAEDLLPYVERDLGEDALLPGPLSAMKTNGQLLSLMPSFSLTAILGPASLLNGRSVNSFAELASLAGGAEHVFYQSVDRETFMKWVFANNRRDYTSEQVADFLSFAAALPEQAIQNPYDLSDAELRDAIEHGETFPLDYRPIHEGTQKFEFALIAAPAGVDQEPSACSIPEAEGYFEEKLSAIGMPNAEGNGIYLSPNQELMMPQACGNKEGAWAFLRFTLNDRYLTNPFIGNFSHGIPLTQSAYERGVETYWKRANGTLLYFINGLDFSLNYDPENCKALFLRLLDQVDGICRDEDEIYNSVISSANSFFNGEKSLEQVSDDITSRLKLYNAERG